MNEIQNPDIASIIFNKDRREEKIQKIERLVTRKVGAKAKFLLDKALELADGIYMTDEKDPYKTKYYKKAPNLEAIIYLIDRLIGKPVAKSEVKDNSEKKGLATIQNLIVNLAGPSRENNGNKNGNTITLGKNDVRVGESSLQK